MWRRAALFLLAPAAAAWVARQEHRILREGERLSPSELDDAVRIGIRHPERIRVLTVSSIPPFRARWLRRCATGMPFVSANTIGLTARYGIFLREDYRHDRSLLRHELAHTAQYERLGGIRPFLRQYLGEWLEVGYPSGALEVEASAVADRFRV
ncbi:MAG: hypothetical protein M3Z64_07825 [Verrucomicrobiota bacterium]|nr:hypothetical protein [Verrucomicrobiota bacterium]